MPTPQPPSLCHRAQHRATSPARLFLIHALQGVDNLLQRLLGCVQRQRHKARGGRDGQPAGGPRAVVHHNLRAGGVGKQSGPGWARGRVARMRNAGGASCQTPSRSCAISQAHLQLHAPLHAGASNAARRTRLRAPRQQRWAAFGASAPKTAPGWRQAPPHLQLLLLPADCHAAQLDVQLCSAAGRAPPGAAHGGTSIDVGGWLHLTCCGRQRCRRTLPDSDSDTQR